MYFCILADGQHSRSARSSEIFESCLNTQSGLTRHAVYFTLEMVCSRAVLLNREAPADFPRGLKMTKILNKDKMSAEIDIKKL